ncbi:MAG: Outer cell wall protein [Candidatus Dichloromethanomonas elyunquensis]|nr:MAG: Outer cell wall protein [Candidatus Dichloromethanomonas elyunquensis]
MVHFYFSVYNQVSNEIVAITGTKVVVLKGLTRLDTVKAINNELENPNGCFIVGYDALADALSVSSYASAHNYAIILADREGRIPYGQRLLGSTAYLIGGTALVSESNSGIRLAGRDRYETNKLILESLDFEFRKIYMANGLFSHLVDSLIAAPLAAKDNAPIILTDNNSVESRNFLLSKMDSSSEVIAMGGTEVVSNTVRDSIGGTESGSSSSLKVNDITPVSLNSFKVLFNQKVDEDTAEIVSNYIVNGDALTVGEDSAVLLSDGKSVLVMVDQESISDMAPFSQQDEVTVEVKKDTIYDQDKNSSAPSFTKDMTMNDVTVPRLSSVKAYGNKKLIVEFTEPVSVLGISSNINDWKIDGNNLSSFGINTSASKGVKATGGTAFPISNAIELYFEAGISGGNHTLTVEDGDSGTSGWLVDGANFVVRESTKDFRIDSVSGAPKVQSVTMDNSKIEIKFNRAMYVDPSDPNSGEGSALNTNYYDVNDEGEDSNLNDSPLSSFPEFKSGSDDTIIEFNIDSGIIYTGANVLEINKNLEDAWGNQLADTDNIRVTFTYKEDNLKPWVKSVSCISDTTVRIHFSEDIDYVYAQSRNNYTIKDADGVEVFGRNAGGSAETVPTNQDSDIVELTMPGGEYLRESDYTLKIENLRDTSINSNVLDTYTTTFDGRDELGPELEEVIADTNDDTKAICFFSEKIDSSTVKLSNFGYRGGDEASRDLPSGSRVSLDSTCKIVTVDFPSAYTVKVAAGGTDDKYEVNAIRASSIKDVSGNIISGIAMTINVQAGISDDYRPNYKENTFNLYDDGSDVKAEFELGQDLSYLDKNDFRIGGNGAGFAGSVGPDSAYTVGDKVVLRFTDDAKVRTIRSLGPNAFLYSKLQADIQSKGTSGVAILEFDAAGYQVYDERIQPRVLTDQPGIDPMKLTFEGDNAVIEIAFSEGIDGSICGLYEDDFYFTCGGSSLDVKNVTVDTTDNRIVKFNVGPVTDLNGTTITARADEAKIDIRDIKDRGQEDNNKYLPSSDDKAGRSITDNTTPTITGVSVDSASEKVTVTFSEAIFVPNSFTDFKVDSPNDEGKTAPVTGTAWIWAADKKSVEITFGAVDFKANDSYSLLFTSPGSSKYKDLGNHYLATVTNTGFVNTSSADTTAPTVCVLIGDAQGNGETITDGGSVYIRFSEILNAASKTAVETALTNGKAGAGTLHYAWDNQTATLIVTVSGGNVTFATDITCDISDGTNNNVGVTILND